eukprot:SAG31_NODE_17441_length_670_cov_1.185639_1_plen_34_part_01
MYTSVLAERARCIVENSCVRHDTAAAGARARRSR